ncbi:MAG: aminoglycoside phosphotransferase family protein [Methylococcales bacterium]|nr:aminoglycoside phosphotransferase family protein [Methylococcales bacterium]
MDSFSGQVSKQFSNAIIIDISALGNGLINDTYLVKTDKDEFVLQQINSRVFPQPLLVMENLIVLNQHIRQKKCTEVKLKVPLVIKTVNQDSCFLDKKNNFWRALEFISNTESKESISNLYEAEQVGFALGHFHRLLCDVRVDLLHDTLPGFHITPTYFQHYQQIEKQNGGSFDGEKVQLCRTFIEGFKSKINSLEVARQKGVLTERIIHGDPKLNNFLFDNKTNKIISLIDLDTVKPGLVHYDIADCLRSCCHNIPSNTFDLEICSVILKSYLKEADAFFNEQDYEFLYPAIELIPFELGLRFFTDFLEGNQYFKVNFPEHNLNRALAQFKLCDSIGRQEAEIKQLIADNNVERTSVRYG